MGGDRVERLGATPGDFGFGLRFGCGPVLMDRPYIPLRSSPKPELAGRAVGFP